MEGGTSLEDEACPLCCEAYEVEDEYFLPCSCNFQVRALSRALACALLRTPSQGQSAQPCRGATLALRPSLSPISLSLYISIPNLSSLFVARARAACLDLCK